MEEGEYSLPRMLEKVLRNDSIMETVLKVKVMGGILATQGSHAHRGAGGQGIKCRLCGKEADGGETNFHVLWQCTGAGRKGSKVVAARRKLQKCVIRKVSAMGLRDADEMMALTFWTLSERGALRWETVEAMAAAHRAEGRDEEIVTALPHN